MAIKTFTTGEVLTAADTNTYLANSGLVYITSAAWTGSVFSIDNCFTSAYKNYRITVTGQSNNGLAYGNLFQWRTGGVNNGANNYVSNVIYSSSSAGPSRYYSGLLTYGVMGTNANPSFSFSADIFAPQTTDYAQYVAEANGFGSSSAEVGTYWGNFNAGTQFDGFYLTSQGPSVTGTVTVYGYRKA